MAVGTVSNEGISERLELLLQCLGVVNDLLLVGLEFRSSSLLECNGKSSDGVVVGTTLVAREDREVNGTLKVVEDLLAGLGVSGTDTLTEEDHGATRTTEGLVGCGGDNIGVLEGRGDDASSDQAGNMGHIDHEVGTDRVGNLPHSLVVDQTAVGRGTGHKDLRAVELSILSEHVIVDDAGLEIDLVREGLEVCGNSRDPVN